MVQAAIRTVLQIPPGGFGGQPGVNTGLGGLGPIAAQNPELAAQIMQSPQAQAALNPSINPYTLTGQGVPYGAYGNINQQMFGGNPYLSQMYGFGDPDIAGAVAGVPIGGMLPGMPGMAPILNYLQQQQAQGGAGAGGSDTSTAGGSAGTSGTTPTTQTTPTTSTPTGTTTPAATTTPASTTTTPATTTTSTPTTTSTTTPLTASQQLQQELQQLATGSTGTSPSTTGTTQSTTGTTTPATTTTTSQVQVPGTSITIPVTTTTNPATGQTTTSATPAATPAAGTTSGTTPASTAPSTPQETARLQYQNWLKSRPTRPTTNTQAGWQQFQQQMQAWLKQAPAGVHMNQGEHRGWGHAGGVFGQQNMQRRGGWMQRGAGQSIGTTGGVAGASGGAGVAAGGAKSRLARACDCEVPPMAADLERTSLSYGKSECNRCTYPFSKGQRKPMILGDQFPYLHGYNFIPGEQVYVRTKVVLYGTDELEEEDTEPWVMEDSALVNCDRTGAFVCLMDIDMDYVDGDTARGAGLVEAHGRSSGRYGRQRLDL